MPGVTCILLIYQNIFYFKFLRGFELFYGFYYGVAEGSLGLSVLRTFRLLRIIKLVRWRKKIHISLKSMSVYYRFLPNLQRSLIVMLRTMDNVAVFFGLLMLFIFIFSILGMNLFGCKFCDPETGNCERKNFDSLLWATVTVFQVTVKHTKK